ncbi:MAG TPA: cyclic nucleotide-binding domain-containing protein, partial [Segetibacter sp.]
MNNPLQILKKSTPFNTLPEDVLSELADLLGEVAYAKEAVIYHQDITEMDGVDIIVKGEYETFFYDSALNKRSVEILKEGKLYGGVSVLLNNKRSIKTVIAKKGTVAYVLPRKDFVELCQTFESFFHYYTAEFGKYMLDDEFAHFVKKPTAFD